MQENSTEIPLCSGWRKNVRGDQKSLIDVESKPPLHVWKVLAIGLPLALLTSVHRESFEIPIAGQFAVSRQKKAHFRASLPLSVLLHLAVR